jgi:hypothetical protein
MISSVCAGAQRRSTAARGHRDASKDFEKVVYFSGKYRNISPRLREPNGHLTTALAALFDPGEKLQKRHQFYSRQT